MKHILKKHNFKGEGNTYYKKAGENIHLEFNLWTKELYVNDGHGQCINLEKSCTNATELDETLTWYFKETPRTFEAAYLFAAFILGAMCCHFFS